MRKTISLIIVLLFISCSNNKETYSKPSFPIAGKLECRVISAFLPFSYPLDICVLDDKVAVFANSKDGWVHLFDKESGIGCGSYVMHGRGPGEILNGIQMNFYPTLSELHIYDEPTMNLCIYKVEHSKDDIVSFERTISFASYGKAVRHVWELPGESCYLADGQIAVEDGKQGRFQIVKDGFLSASYNMFPVRSRTKQKSFYSSAFAISPDRSKFVNGTLFGAILEMFDVSETEIRQSGCRMIYNPDIEFSSGVVRHTEKMMWGFSALCASDDEVYSVFINGKDPGRFNNISVFDWNGNEIATYETDYDLLRICCDNSIPGRLYAVAVKNGEYYLSRIDIPDRIL